MKLIRRDTFFVRPPPLRKDGYRFAPPFLRTENTGRDQDLADGSGRGSVEIAAATSRRTLKIVARGEKEDGAIN